jgi:TetR/AcrR family transcriptional repressor of nem operon
MRPEQEKAQRGGRAFWFLLSISIISVCARFYAINLSFRISDLGRLGLDTVFLVGRRLASEVNPRIIPIIQLTDMRYEAEHKTRTRDRIVRNAARKFRGEGLSGAGVADVMKASGLTVGGFYKHFRSKDELLSDALAQSLSEFDEKVVSELKDVPREDRWKEIVRWYLSPEHCDRPDTGCPIAALAPEIARGKSKVRKRVAGLLLQRRDFLLDLMPGGTAAEQERNFFVLFSAMTGAISIARIFPEAEDRRKVLDSVRNDLLQRF